MFGQNVISENGEKCLSKSQIVVLKLLFCLTKKPTFYYFKNNNHIKKTKGVKFCKLRSWGEILFVFVLKTTRRKIVIDLYYVDCLISAAK